VPLPAGDFSDYESTRAARQHRFDLFMFSILEELNDPDWTPTIEQVGRRGRVAAIAASG
jgi:hypothetical protein